MKVTFYSSGKNKYDIALAKAFTAGCSGKRVSCGVTLTSDWAGSIDRDTDVAVIVGVKDRSGPIMQAYQAAGRQVIFFDKGYTRLRGGQTGTLYWRVSLNAFQPLAYIMTRPRDGQRWRRLGLEIRPPRRPGSGDNILFAGSSQKFCDLNGLGNATEYARKVLHRIRELTNLPIIYRPKPSWKDGSPIEGFGFSGPDRTFTDEIRNTHALVTYGSNACFEALLHGVPTVILGNGITLPLSSSTLEEIENPRRPSHKQVARLAYSVSYCQWTLDEIEAGECWRDLLGLMG